MENTNITGNTRQAGHSADSTINAGTDIKSSTTNTSQHTIDDINSGQQPLEAESTLRLSDMYEKNVDNPELELTVRVININTDNYAGNKARTINSKYSNGSGRNSKDNNNFNRTNMYTYSSEFLSKCETLKDYMTFVNKVRIKTDIEKIDIRTAVTEAVDECIAENVLSEFFRNHREEVITVSIYEYDEEGHLEVVKEEGRQLGLAEGKIKERSNGIKVFIKLCKEVNLSDEDTIYKLMKNYKLSKEEAVNAIKNNSEHFRICLVTYVNFDYLWWSGYY